MDNNLLYSRSKYKYYLWFIIVFTIVYQVLTSNVVLTAQSSDSAVTVTGANDTFKAQLAQPDDLFGSLGVTEAEVAQELSERPRIAVFGAGAVRNSYLASLTNQEQPPSTVVVVAAGSVRDFRLSMLQEEHAAIEAAISIDVTGAGSVRDVGLMWATFE